MTDLDRDSLGEKISYFRMKMNPNAEQAKIIKGFYKNPYWIWIFACLNLITYALYAVLEQSILKTNFGILFTVDLAMFIAIAVNDLIHLNNKRMWGYRSYNEKPVVDNNSNKQMQQYMFKLERQVHKAKVNHYVCISIYLLYLLWNFIILYLLKYDGLINAYFIFNLITTVAYVVFCLYLRMNFKDLNVNFHIYEERKKSKLPLK